MNQSPQHRLDLPINTNSSLASVKDPDLVNILIVDDDHRNLNVIEAILDDPSYRLVRVESADKALSALVEQEFALLILDIRMPDLTGFELAQMIKGRKKSAGVPIIFLTAYYNEDQDVLTGYNSGAVDFMHKPVNPAILRAKVAIFVELYLKKREHENITLALQTEIAERRLAQKQLHELNESLELRVASRVEALIENEIRYQTLFELVPVAVYSCDESGVIRNYNKRAAELWGGDRPASDDPDMRYWGPSRMLFQDGSYMSDTQSPMSEILTGTIEYVHDMEIIIERPDGTRIDCLLNILPLKDQYGHIRGSINCFYDISERKHLEMNLRLAKALAEKANLAKSEFLSSMSHDLRTPLNAILGFAQLMESTSPPPTVFQKRSIEQILKAGWYLLHLVNEILDLALVESGKMELSLEPVSLSEVLRECQDMIEPLSLGRNISMIFPDYEQQYFVNADRTRLKQIFINLLSNAVKYNRVDGTVQVDFITNNPGRIRISVRDTGEGLSREQLTHLFEPFNRLGREDSNTEGSGIGLVMTKRLVNLMGGGVGVESTVGKGSRFWIELDLVSESKAAISNMTPVINHDQVTTGSSIYTLLYVEDNPANLMLIEEIIALRPDIRLLSAADGRQGIQVAINAQPDVILMDINLPDINGNIVRAMLAKNPATAQIPVIALSANAMSCDIEKGLQAGFCKYLVKPIKINDLFFALDETLKLANRNQPVI